MSTHITAASRTDSEAERQYVETLKEELKMIVRKRVHWVSVAQEENIDVENIIKHISWWVKDGVGVSLQGGSQRRLVNFLSQKAWRQFYCNLIIRKIFKHRVLRTIESLKEKFPFNEDILNEAEFLKEYALKALPCKQNKFSVDQMETACENMEYTLKSKVVLLLTMNDHYTSWKTWEMTKHEILNLSEEMQMLSEGNPILIMQIEEIKKMAIRQLPSLDIIEPEEMKAACEVITNRFNESIMLIHERIQANAQFIKACGF